MTVDVDRQLRDAVELELIGALYLQAGDELQPIQHTTPTSFGEGSFTEDEGRAFVAYKGSLPLYDDRLQLAGQLYGKRTQLEPPRRELQRRAKDDGLLDEGGCKAIRPRRSLEEEVPLLIGERTKGRVRSVGGTQYDEGIHQGSLVRLADEGPLQPRLIGALGSEDSSEGKDEEDK